MKNPILLILIILSISCKDNTANANPKRDANWDSDLFNKGYNEMQAENYLKAIEYFNEVINSSELTEFSFVTAYCYISRGASKGELGDIRGAISDFTTVLNKTRLQEVKSSAYHMRGSAYLKMDNIDLACEDLSKAGELGMRSSYQLIKDYCN